MKRAVIALIAVIGAAGLATAFWWFVLSSPAERSAREDADALSVAVAAHVAGTGRLPRITVTPGPPGGGDSIWGPEFLVESEAVPRSDPSRARTFFLVGEPGSWCVEILYLPPSLFSDSSGAWVSVHGEGGHAGSIIDGRCRNGYLLELTPVDVGEGPSPGTVVDGARAPVGTCFANPFEDARPSRLEVLSCGESHFGEVFFAGQGSASDFSRFEEEAADTCASALAAFVGVPRAISSFTAEPLTVDESEWRSGSRAFSCILYMSSDDYPLVGSARDSWR